MKWRIGTQRYRMEIPFCCFLPSQVADPMMQLFEQRIRPDELRDELLDDDATAGLFVLGGLLIFIIGVKRNWSPRKTYGWGGILLGLAITCHYRYLYMPIVLMMSFIAVRERLVLSFSMKDGVCASLRKATPRTRVPEKQLSATTITCFARIPLRVVVIVEFDIQ